MRHRLMPCALDTGAIQDMNDSSDDNVDGFAAQPEPGEDAEVARAKYFIRDEFLVRLFFNI